METPLVSICSITYNHAPFIRQCLDGFLMQQCNFPIEIIINDDCSTDGTTEIIREYAEKYPDKIFPIFHEENQYSKGVRGMAQKFVCPKARGKYIALCEGDDYWTDPLKLQKQVDFLESHPDYGMVYMDYDALYYPLNVRRRNCYGQGYTKLYSNKDFYINKGYRAPLTWLVRTHLMMNMPEHGKIDSTYVYMLEIILSSFKVGYLNESSAVYRILENSASHPTTWNARYHYAKDLYDTQVLYMPKFFLTADEVQKLRESNIRLLSQLAYFSGDKELMLEIVSEAEDASISVPYIEKIKLFLDGKLDYDSIIDERKLVECMERKQKVHHRRMLLMRCYMGPFYEILRFIYRRFQFVWKKWIKS